MRTEAMKLMVQELEYVLSCINEDKVPFDGDDFHEALRLGRQAIEQAQKQEPVAWLNRDSVDGLWYPNAFKTDNLEPSMPLYTSPPQRQPLTDKEIDAATQYWAGAVTVPLERLILCREYARAIEAAHGIKGEA